LPLQEFAACDAAVAHGWLIHLDRVVHHEVGQHKAAGQVDRAVLVGLRLNDADLGAE
jgi:hypothetical protein